MTLTTRVGAVIIVQHYTDGSAFISDLNDREHPVTMFAAGPDALIDAINAAEDIATEDENWSELIGHMHDRSASWTVSHKQWDARRASWPAIAYGAPYAGPPDNVRFYNSSDL